MEKSNKDEIMFMLGGMEADIKTIKEQTRGLVSDVDELKDFKTNVKTKVALVSGAVGFIASQWHSIINFMQGN